ncbi:MAG TPA: hypothetical protein VN667_12960, partial [Burkholderiales bacterium]|nr:hypothetical protein [Burkholderiales bacterium]
MMQRWLMLSILMLLVATAADAQEALDFKGVKLGALYSEFNVPGGRWSCQPFKRTLSDQVCSQRDNFKETIAGRPVQGITLFFYDERLATIIVAFHPDDFDTVVQALNARYGKAAKQDAVLVRSRAGVEYKNDRIIWKPLPDTITTERYGDSLERTTVQFTSGWGDSISSK